VFRADNVEITQDDIVGGFIICTLREKGGDAIDFGNPALEEFASIFAIVDMYGADVKSEPT
jgi:hypothetical protein